jgi:hypothetical protein
MFWPYCQKFQKFRLHVSEIEPGPHLEISTLDVNTLNTRTIREL